MVPGKTTSVSNISTGAVAVSQQSQSIVTVRGVDHLVAKTFEDSRGKIPNRRFVFHHQ